MVTDGKIGVINGKFNCCFCCCGDNSNTGGGVNSAVVVSGEIGPGKDAKIQKKKYL